jgi:hypothetical protein
MQRSGVENRKGDEIALLLFFSAAPSRRAAGMQRRPSDEPPKKTRILNIQNIFMKHTILFFFLHRRSQRRASMPYSFFLDPSVHPPAALTLRFAPLCCLGFVV